MNKVILTGRFVADPEVRYGNDNQSAIATFTLAVNRKFVKKDDPNAQTADFPRCIAFGKTAEFVGKFFSKGSKADVVGRLQTGKYTNREGQTVYTTDVIVEDIEFGESKKASGGDSSGNQSQGNNSYGNSGGGFNGGYQSQQPDFINIPENVNEALPFV